MDYTPQSDQSAEQKDVLTEEEIRDKIESVWRFVHTPWEPNPCSLGIYIGETLHITYWLEDDVYSVRRAVGGETKLICEYNAVDSKDAMYQYFGLEP